MMIIGVYLLFLDLIFFTALSLDIQYGLVTPFKLIFTIFIMIFINYIYIHAYQHNFIGLTLDVEPQKEQLIIYTYKRQYIAAYSNIKAITENIFHTRYVINFYKRIEPP